MIVDLFFKQSGEFKLNIRLQAVIPADLIVLALGDFRSQGNVIHREHELQKTKEECER